MIISISSQNMIFAILMIIIMITIFVFVMIEKEYKRFLNFIFSDFELLEDLIIFINYIFRRDKFKRFKHYHYSFFIS